MSILHHSPAPVHRIAIVGLPETARHDAQPSHEGAEPGLYSPTPEDLAYDTGWEVGRADGVFRMPNLWYHDGRGLRFAMGRQEGRRRRERDQARELGLALGLETELSEPPAGMLAHEKAAYREGFAEGLAERRRLEDESRDEDLYYDMLAQERAEWAFGDPTDRVHQAELIECGYHGRA